MKLNKFAGFLLAAASVAGLVSCSEYKPNGYEEVPTLPKVSNLAYTEANKEITLTWDAPSAENLEGFLLIVNNNFPKAIQLDKDVTSYTIAGAPMEPAFDLYTVKCLYADNRMSTGNSVQVMVPYEELQPVTDLTAVADGRQVTLNWTLPQSDRITGVQVVAKYGDVVFPPVQYEGANLTSVILGGQPNGQLVTYEVMAVYDKYYPSNVNNAMVEVQLELVQTPAAFLLLADKAADLPDDDEVAAATWFEQNFGGDAGGIMVRPSELANLDPNKYPVLWIMVDREGIGMGWEKLPSELIATSTIDAIAAYTKAGGNLYLSNMATQLTIPLGVLPDTKAPTVFGDGAGGSGHDVWTINPILGAQFRDTLTQGYYDRTEHEIYKGLVFENPNNWTVGATGAELIGLPLIGPGQREDHNCLWDLNKYGKGDELDVIANFEKEENCLVLATWGHVQDHCVAGLVVFNKTADHSVVVANGFAAYEWNQNDHMNIYQSNVNKLTSNIIEYLMAQ